MSFSIIGFGAVGQALAKMYARKDIEVTVATTRPPETLVAKANEIGPKVIPKALAEATGADIMLLAVPYWSHRDVAKASADWRGRTIIDVTNSYGISPEELGDLPSTAVVAKAFAGAKVVKAFNHLAAPTLALDPAVGGGRRVIFVSSDDDDATSQVAELVERLGFAPLSLGDLQTSGKLVQAHGDRWAPLIFQDLIKL